MCVCVYVCMCVEGCSAAQERKENIIFGCHGVCHGMFRQGSVYLSV
jgi:hypothetical protein